MKRFVVTGGLGFVGNEVVRQLTGMGKDVLIVDDRNRVALRSEDVQSIPVVEADLLSPKLIAAFADFKPDAVIHLAAIHFIPECNSDPQKTLRVNVSGTKAILEAATRSGVKSVVIASSGAVYANTAEALTEESECEPVDIYGYSKLFCEGLCRLSALQSGLPITAARLFNVYGPRETNAHIIPEVLGQLKNSDVLELGNIEPKRDYIHVSDAAQGFIRFALAPPDGFRIANLTSSDCYSVREVIELISKILGREVRVETDPARFRKSDKMVQHGSMEFTEKVLGWRPEVQFEAGLTQLMEWEGLL